VQLSDDPNRQGAKDPIDEKAHVALRSLKL
jgi:hypothetical protein